MKKGLLVLLMGCMVVVGHAQHKKRRNAKFKPARTVVQPGVNQVAMLQNAMLLCPSRDSLPAWHLHHPADFKFPSNYPVPTNYQVFGTIYNWFKKSLTQVPYKPESRTFTFPAPLTGGVGCITYNLHRVQTMDSALQAKYPELMSFAGSQVGNPLNDIRIDCNETDIRLMIRHEGETYFINSMPYRETYLFVAFNKNDAGYSKKPFETKK